MSAEGPDADWTPARRARPKYTPRMPELEAEALERSEGVWGLAAALRSREVSELLQAGYAFVGVWRGAGKAPPPSARPIPLPSGAERVIPIPGNRWNDCLILGAAGGSPAPPGPPGSPAPPPAESGGAR